MPRSTSSLRFGTGQAWAPVDNGEALEILDPRHASLEANNQPPSSMRRPAEGGPLEELVGWLARSLALLAVLSSVAVLCIGATPWLTAMPRYVAAAAFSGWAALQSLPLSALPLLLAGSSYLILQGILRPRPMELLKRSALGAAFLLWGVVQLMPVGILATELGNLVIALYVVDLALIIWTELQKNQPEPAR